MTTHISLRLAWHDRGWDGGICDRPHENGHCIALEHVRTARDDEKERKAAGTELAQLGWRPPCFGDPGAYSPVGYTVLQEDPLPGRGLVAVEADLPPYSSFGAPFAWMREDMVHDLAEYDGLDVRGPDNPSSVGAWVREPDRQRAILEHFWGRIEPKRSLVFYYCNHGNPLDESGARVLVGVGRVAKISPATYYGRVKDYNDDYPVWYRSVQQDYPEQGVRLPYQEYLAKGLPTDGIVCRVPGGSRRAFSYVAEHVPDDLAVGVLERVIQSIQRVRDDGLVPGDWQAALAWLDQALDDCWEDRGAYPGIGSVLRHLGCSTAVAYHRSDIAPLHKQGIDPWTRTVEVLEAPEDPGLDHPHRLGLMQARARWKALPQRRDLLALLARFAVTSDQVRGVAIPEEREKRGIAASEEDILANPYLLPELDCGTKDSEAITLDTVDRGMLPDRSAAHWIGGLAVEPDDIRRVRAIAVEILGIAADEGDTVLRWGVLMDRVQGRFPGERSCPVDRQLVEGHAEFLAERFWLDLDHQPKLAALAGLHRLESETAAILRRRAKKLNPAPASPVDWRSALETEFGPPETPREKAALTEKEAALNRLFGRRLAVLTGGAGTGKTRTVRVFLEGAKDALGSVPPLLLAPTGKARVRLSTVTKRNAQTIHQFLLRQGWLSPETFTLRDSGEKAPYPAEIVVIDECSMIPTDLLGTLLRAIDMNTLTRLVLVGDPNQLPPIGPGRPFVDLVAWLAEEHPDALTRLSVCMRTDGDGHESAGLALADGYHTNATHAADDALLSELAMGAQVGDVDIGFWHDADELDKLLRDRLGQHLRFGQGDWEGFNRSLGIDEGWSGAEAWQILTPTRAQHFGTDGLNRAVQMEFRGGLIAQAESRYGKQPKPFGSRRIVKCEKVIQVRNDGRDAWPRKTGLDYVANGEIGLVSKTSKGDGRYPDSFDVVFSTQPDVSYRYWGSGDADANLDLAYALTVHKAQGSDFDTVFFILPKKARTLSRELLYTALTRFRKRLVLLVEGDTGALISLRNPELSETRRRNTNMFELSLAAVTGESAPFPERLIHRTRLGDAVRSKSEVIVADVLQELGITYEYEKPLHAKDGSFRLPDFTVWFDGDQFFWEHLGMLDQHAYREAWLAKRSWYEANGFADRLITSEDGPGGSIDSGEIERLARTRILEEAP